MEARGFNLLLRLNLTDWKFLSTIELIHSIPTSLDMWQFMVSSPTIPVLMETNSGVSGKGGCWRNQYIIFCASVLSRFKLLSLLSTCCSDETKSTPLNCSTA